MPKKSKQPLCPKCGDPVGKSGTSVDGVQRWSHSTRGTGRGCQWHGTRPAGVESAESTGVDPKVSRALHGNIRRDKRAVRRYVITAAQNATPVNALFFATLKHYCAVNNAQLIVIPYRYKNPTSMWSEKAKDDDWWASELAPYLLDRRVELNKNLVILGDIKTQPTSSAPLQGFETITGARSAVIGHPRLELKTVATPQSKLPKIMTTTGACTQKNYIPSKAGKQGEFHHTFGGCVVEVVGDVFHMRQLNALKDGSFMDLEYEYKGEQRMRVPSAAALVMGDSHVEFIDPGVVEATFGRNGIVARLHPKVLVWHDLHDFYSRNHHHKHEPFINFAKHHAGVDNVREQLQKTFDFVDKHTPALTTNVFVPSNHPDALARWVKETDPRADHENAIFWAETYTAMCVGAHMSETGAKTIDPFLYWADRMLKCAGRTQYLGRDQSLQIAGIEVGFHGDRGPNGSRGTLKGFTKVGVKTITGHGHAPGIEGGAYRVGTNSRLALEYNSGPSGWLHTDVVIYANGKRSLINIIGGEWRA